MNNDGACNLTKLKYKIFIKVAKFNKGHWIK